VRGLILRFYWNYTSNCGPMWRAAGADLAKFDGTRASECAPILRAAIENMVADPARYRALDPPNGWGSYDTLLPRLRYLLRWLERNPTATVQVSR
jgi:hypothetical protein